MQMGKFDLSECECERQRLHSALSICVWETKRKERMCFAGEGVVSGDVY